jgi:hypothetical protein
LCQRACIAARTRARLSLYEDDPNPSGGSPRDLARTPGAFRPYHQRESFRDPDRAFDLQTGAGARKIADDAINAAGMVERDRPAFDGTVPLFLTVIVHAPATYSCPDYPTVNNTTGITDSVWPRQRARPEFHCLRMVPKSPGHGPGFIASSARLTVITVLRGRWFPGTNAGFRALPLIAVTQQKFGGVGCGRLGSQAL